METSDQDVLRTALAAAIQGHPVYNATSLARAIGRDGTYLRDFIKGKKESIGAREIAALEERLGQRLFSAPKPQADGPTRAPPVEGYRPPPELLGPRDFPIYASTEGGPGAMVVTNDVIEMVQRPWYMRDVPGYGVLVIGESMDPAFRPGDIAIVNPKLPVIRGRNAIFVAGEDRGEFRATIKEFQRQDTKHWHVRQHNPPDGQEKDFTLEKREWSKALRVVGKYEGG